ncbi:MucBP domain-containing protein [Enterococcus sp. AZ196]|uniref:MucBP domain-containing protein n=1 Tax=Enterococcus sp. AZ196 TaxID=2774659 RepID=UPI003D270C4A
MDKKKLKFIYGVVFCVFFFCVTEQRAFADEIAVDTIVELQDAVKNAPEDRRVTLSDSFPTDISTTITLAESPYQVEVNGGGKTLQSTAKKQLFSYGSGTGTAASSLTLKNFNFAGLGNNTRALSISGYKGEFILENTVVDSFRGYDDGSAFYTSGNTTIKSCTFSNNVNDASGYSGGAIASKGYSASFKVYNSKFIANETLKAGTGNVGGEGGAIYFFQPSASAKFTFKNNYFEGNKSVEDTSSGGKAKLADGGAIAFFNTVTGTDIQFDGNSFVGNVAGDDGGAILIQTNDNNSSAATFVNNTFSQNKALGQDRSSNNGGAIQIYANGGMSEGRRAVVDYINNSFVENIAAYDGGAIGSSGYITNYSAGRYANNLFAGNKARTASKNNIADSNVTGAGNIESNLGYDNGTVTSVTMENVFGTAPVGLVDNYNKITAGTSSDAIILPTVPIAPEKLADDQIENLRDVNEDQRGLPRTTKADIGSVEIDWIKYDSNGGIFDLGTTLEKYEGTIYYEGTQPETYYQVGYKDLDQTIPAGTDLKATRDGYQFAGWSKDKDAKDPDTNFTAGQTITIPKGNETLYAVWKKSEPVIVHYMTYDENNQLVQISPDETLTGTLGESYHAQIKQIDDYAFSGVKEGDSITGTFSDQAKEITLIYTKLPKEKGTLLVQYQDDSGKPLASDEMSVGEIGSDYTTTQKDIQDYTLKEIQGNPSGQYVLGVTQVIYVYTKNPAEQGKVLVHYQDEEQNPLSSDIELTGDIDDFYAAEVKHFEGYFLKGIEGNYSGKYKAEDQEVTLTYAKMGIGIEKGIVLAQYQDKSGKPLAGVELLMGEIGSNYTTTQKNIEGFELKEVQGNAEGQYVEGITEVIYVYEKITEPIINGKVTIRYRDEAGKAIEGESDFTDEQPIGTPLPIALMNKTIPGYQWKEIQGLTGEARYTKEAQIITIIYKKQEGLLIVNYISDSGKVLFKPIVTRGAVGSKYMTERKEFENYRLVKPGPTETGNYTMEPQIVTYVYTNKGSVTIRYVDELENELAPTEQKNVEIGKAYETSEKSIKGWKVKEVPKNAKGIYQGEEQTITYVYIKDTRGGANGNAESSDGAINGQTNSSAKNYTTVATSPKTPQVASSKVFPRTGEDKKGSIGIMLVGLIVFGLVGFIFTKTKINH